MTEEVKEKPAVTLSALTMWTPWQEAILSGEKAIENRPWKLPDAYLHRWIGLHCGEREKEDTLQVLAKMWPDMPKGEYPKGQIVGLVKFSGCVPLNRLDPLLRSQWAFGPWCWIVSGYYRLAQPIECKGKQKLWTVDSHLLTAEIKTLIVLGDSHE